MNTIEIPRYLIISGQVKNRLVRDYIDRPDIGDIIMEPLAKNNPEIGKFISAMMMSPGNQGSLHSGIALMGGIATCGTLTYRVIELQAEEYKVKKPRVSEETRNRTIEELLSPKKMELVKEMIITNQNLVGLIEDIQTVAENEGVTDISSIPLTGFGVYLMIKNEELKQHSH